MKNEIKIDRIETIEQIVQCAPVLTNAYNNQPWNESWTIQTATGLLSCYYNTPGFRGWVATVGQQIIGACIGNTEPDYTGNIFYLKQIFVAVKWQKAGVGRQLIASMKIDIETAGIPTIILFTIQPIFEFYSKTGFVETERMRPMIYTKN